MSADVYVKSMRYEVFICKAFNDYDRSKPGLDISYMRNLIDTENGESWVSHLPPFSKQLETIKKYMDKGFDKIISRVRTPDKKKEFLILQLETRKAKTSKELLDLIENALELF